MLVGALAGAALGYAGITALEHLRGSLKHLPWTDWLGIWLGVTMAGIGLVLYVMSFNRREVAQSLEGWNAKLPATNEEISSFRLQATTLFLAGVLMLLPILIQGRALAQSGSGALVFAGIVVLFAVQTVVNVSVWRHADEFLRGQMLLVGAVTFAIGQGALFLCAAAERLGLVARVPTWDTLVLMMTLYLFVGAWFGIKNRPGAACAE
jgi:hypothetical protein